MNNELHNAATHLLRVLKGQGVGTNLVLQQAMARLENAVINTPVEVDPKNHPLIELGTVSEAGSEA